tara:strand:+ start:1611 stop:1721 length:111 start_codon:yes stop_codon:yes gene_type:complete
MKPTKIKWHSKHFAKKYVEYRDEEELMRLGFEENEE